MIMHDCGQQKMGVVSVGQGIDKETHTHAYTFLFCTCCYCKFKQARMCFIIKSKPCFFIEKYLCFISSIYPNKSLPNQIFINLWQKPMTIFVSRRVLQFFKQPGALSTPQVLMKFHSCFLSAIQIDE